LRADGTVSGSFCITGALFPFNFHPRRSIIHARSIAAPRHRQPPLRRGGGGKWSSATLWNLKSIFGAARPTIFASISRKHHEESRRSARDLRDFPRRDLPRSASSRNHLSRSRALSCSPANQRERERERERERIDGVVQSPGRWKQADRTGRIRLPRGYREKYRRPDAEKRRVNNR